MKLLSLYFIFVTIGMTYKIDANYHHTKGILVLFPFYIIVRLVK